MILLSISWYFYVNSGTHVSFVVTVSIRKDTEIKNIFFFSYLMAFFHISGGLHLGSDQFSPNHLDRLLNIQITIGECCSN